MANNEPRKESESVSVPKDVWEKVQARLAALESKSEDEEAVIGGDDGKAKPAVVRVKTHDGRPVTRVHSVVETGIDETTKKPVVKCTIVTVGKDGSEKEHVGQDYLAFCNAAPSKSCDVIEVKSEKKVRKGDLVDERFYDEKTKNMVTTGRKVRLAVNYSVTRHVVDFEGEKVELDEVNF